MRKIAKKAKRKWNRAHFFKQRKKNRKSEGHPAYVYAKSGRVYKYISFTHKPIRGKEYLFEKLEHNINPKEKHEPTYIMKRYDVCRDDAFEPPHHCYRIHDDDKPKVKKYMK